jgi:membrane protein DedA with SNARE-associated domain
VDPLLGFLNDSSPFLIYAALGVGAAIENIIPPIPADTFVLLGGFLAARDHASEVAVFLVTWTANVLSAVAVYAAAYRHGASLFETRIGRYLLDAAQLAAVRRFYDRWGTAAIFYTRFLPGLRAVVPVFAGVSHHKPVFVVAPIAAASAIWYAGIVWVGSFAGHNLERILALQSSVNVTLTVITVLLLVPIGIWWVRSRRTSAQDSPKGQDPIHPHEPEQDQP